MKNLIIVVIAGLFVAGIVAGYQYVWLPRQQELSPQKLPLAEENVTPTPQTPTPTLKGETVDWKTYRNEKYGFEIKYPEGWNYITNNYNEQLLIGFYEGKYGGEGDAILTVSWNVTLQERYNKMKQYFEKSFKVTESFIRIDNADGKLLTIESPGFSRSAFFENKGYIYNFEMGAGKEVLFEQMLSTFKFIEPKDETADWKTYTNQTYGISFKYPADWTIKERSDWPNAILALGINAAGYEPKPDMDMPNSARFQLYENVSKLDNQNLAPSSLKDYLDKYSALSDPIYKNVKNKKIGKLEGYSGEAGPNQFGGGIYYFAELSNKQVASFWLFNEKADLATMDKILSTFKFIK